MSRASKITFALTTTLSVATVFIVHNLQREEREALHQGPIKDRERVAAKQAQKEQTQAQKERMVEYEMQKQLREEFAKAQDVSDSNKPPIESKN